MFLYKIIWLKLIQNLPWALSLSSYVIMLLILTWNNQKEKAVDHYGSNKLIIKNLLGLNQYSTRIESSSIIAYFWHKLIHPYLWPLSLSHIFLVINHKLCHIQTLPWLERCHNFWGPKVITYIYNTVTLTFLKLVIVHHKGFFLK